MIDDYCEVDNETRIILYENKLYCYWFESDKEFVLDLKTCIDECAKTNRIIKVGRNILIAHRNSLTISHFLIGEDSLTFVNNHTYPEKLKGGIVSV